MTKPEFASRLSEITGLSRKLAKDVLTAVGVILEEDLLKTGTVKVFSLGKVLIKTLGKRQGRNPQTGETITIGPTRVLRYQPGHSLKATVREG